MKHCEVSQIFFRETYSVPAEQTRRLFRLLPYGKAYAERMVNATATGYLVSALESICAREMQPHLDQDEETIVGSAVQCGHHAPIPPGALVTVNGWVVGLGDREATFWVQASDEHGVVCEGHIRLSIASNRDKSSCLSKRPFGRFGSSADEQLPAPDRVASPLDLLLNLRTQHAALGLISQPVGNPWGARPEASSHAGTSRSQPGGDHESSFDNV